VRVNWPAIGQAIIIALLLGVGTAVMRTYILAERIPDIERRLEINSEKLSDLRAAISALKGGANEFGSKRPTEDQGRVASAEN